MKLEFPLQFKRQYADNLDADYRLTTSERIEYLNSPLRYAGQPVYDVTEDKPYYLNATLDAWLPYGDTEIPAEQVPLIDLTYADLIASMAGGTLIAGYKYRVTDYRTKHRIEHTDVIHTGAIEPLVFKAQSNSTLFEDGVSDVYAGEIVRLNFSDNTVEPAITGGLDEPSEVTARTGRMIHRYDPVRLIEAKYDYREVTFRRWKVNGLLHALASYDSASNTFTANILEEWNRCGYLNSEYTLSSFTSVTLNEGMTEYQFNTVATHGLGVGSEVVIYDQTKKASYLTTVETVPNTKALKVVLPATFDVGATPFASLYVCNPNRYTEYLVEIPNITYTANPFLKIVTPNGVERTHLLKLYNNGSITTANIKAKKLVVYYSPTYNTYVAYDHTTHQNTISGYLMWAPNQVRAAIHSHGDWNYAPTFPQRYNIVDSDFQDYKTFANLDLTYNVRLGNVTYENKTMRYANTVFKGAVTDFLPKWALSNTFEKRVIAYHYTDRSHCVIATQSFDYRPKRDTNGLQVFMHHPRQDTNYANNGVTMTYGNKVLWMGGYTSFQALSMDWGDTWVDVTYRAWTSTWQWENGVFKNLTSTVIQGQARDLSFDTSLKNVYFEFDSVLNNSKVNSLRNSTLLCLKESNSLITIGNLSGGYSATASGEASNAEGIFTQASGKATHAGGIGSVGKTVIASGLASFNHSTVNTTGNVGTAASYSAILGGIDNQVLSTAQRSTVIGGSGITATVADTVYVPNLRVRGTITDFNGNPIGGSGGQTVDAYTKAESDAKYSLTGHTHSNMVKSVNGLSPDSNGNVTVTVSGGTSYTHPSGFSLQPSTALTDANVISQVTVNSEGHVTGVQTRALTAASIGAAATSHTHSEYAGETEATTNSIAKRTVDGSLNVVNLYASGNVQSNSDRKLKDNVTPYGAALEKVEQMNPVSYNRNDLENKLEIGFISQELRLIEPLLTGYNASTDTHTVDYARITVLLVVAVKELAAEVRRLKGE